MEKFKDAFRKTQGYAAFKGSLMRDEVIFSRDCGAFKLPYVQDCFVTFSAGRVSIAIQPEEPPAPVLNVDDWFDIPVPPFPNLETAPRISRSRYSDLETLAAILHAESYINNLKMGFPNIRPAGESFTDTVNNHLKTAGLK